MARPPRSLPSGRRWTAVARGVLVAAILLSTQGMLFVNLAFRANQRYIAETMCVNKDRPELHCDGTCQLAKMREAQARRDAQRQGVLELVAATFAAPTLVPTALPDVPTAVPLRDLHRRPVDEVRREAGTRPRPFQPPRGTSVA